MHTCPSYLCLLMVQLLPTLALIGKTLKHAVRQFLERKKGDKEGEKEENYLNVFKKLYNVIIHI